MHRRKSSGLHKSHGFLLPRIIPNSFVARGSRKLPRQTTYYNKWAERWRGRNQVRLRPSNLPPRLYKCGGNVQAPFFITDTRTSSWLLHSAADIFAKRGGIAAKMKSASGPVPSNCSHLRFPFAPAVFRKFRIHGQTLNSEYSEHLRGGRHWAGP